MKRPAAYLETNDDGTFDAFVVGRGFTVRRCLSDALAFVRDLTGQQTGWVPCFLRSTGQWDSEYDLATEVILPRSLICARADGCRNAIAGSTRSPCSRCYADVMVSPAGRNRLRPCDTIVCGECAVVIAEERGVPWVDAGRNQEQLDELAANGHAPRQFAFGSP